MTSVSDVIIAAEVRLGRPLEGDEVVLIGRMVEAEKSEDEILELLEVPIVRPSEDEGKTYRYEASGQGVKPIPGA